MTQCPLLENSCRPVSAEEDFRIRRGRMVEPPAYLESALGLSVDERIAIEEAAAGAETQPSLSQGRPAESFYKCLLGVYVDHGYITCVVHLMPVVLEPGVIRFVSVYVVKQLNDLTQRGCCVGLRLTRESSLWRVDCHFVDGIEIKTVLVSVVRAEEQWHTSLSRDVATTLSCVESISNLCVVCVDDFPAVG